MKCIQALKSYKNIVEGTIIRVEDKEADSQVKDGYWKYVSKSEWKNSQPKSEPKSKEEVEKKEKTISKKAENRSKLKQKQRQ